MSHSNDNGIRFIQVVVICASRMCLPTRRFGLGQEVMQALSGRQPRGDWRFCELTQDCDEEGCLRLRRLPTPAEATVMEVLGIRKRAELSPEELAKRGKPATCLARGREAEKSPQSHLPHRTASQ